LLVEKINRQQIGEIDQNLFSILSTISDCIDFDASKSQKRVIPKEGVNDFLDEVSTCAVNLKCSPNKTFQLRRTYEDLDSFLTTFAKNNLSKDKYNHPLLGILRVVYYPQIGFQVAVARKEEESLDIYLSLPIDDMEYQV